ncbi:uncharacterized protein LOC133815043 [Humulus lupulus]|uniref:uncharacterized protein LOC133815043 n=1 Tax=Humulus lupulus TaxID=3486 RepID=UPI002B40E9E0|nr:uncharacterized protein LOC133815043 [Humulus lupulus]
MEVRSALLPSMTDIEKSVKQLVTEANLRLFCLLAPHQDVRESTAVSAIGTEVPKQQQDVSQPPPRRAIGVTINEPTDGPRPAAAPTPPGKGEKKASEPILESSDESDMPAEHAFDLYAKSVSKRKSHKRQSGEGCSNPPAKKSRTDDPPASTPTKETTPPPALAREATPPPPVNPDPPSSVRQTPPSSPADLKPPMSIIQQSAGRREEASGDDLTCVVLDSAKDKLSIITKHCHSREAIQETGSMAVDQVFHRALNEVLALSAAKARYTKQLKVTKVTHAEQLKVIEVKHSGALKEVEEKHTKALKEAEAKHLEVLQVTEAKIASLEEELKKKEASISKVTTSKEQYKETSLINYREAHKLQAELEISRKEFIALEEENARNLEDYEGAAFECFYLF